MSYQRRATRSGFLALVPALVMARLWIVHGAMPGRTA
jgi:hypothetical protein